MSNERKNPTFTVYCGPMFSGKSSRLFLALETLRHKNKRVVLFKPAIDTRGDKGRVTTHNGMSSVEPAVIIDSASDVLHHVASLEHKPDVVAVDEAFMLPGIADTLLFLYRLETSIIVSSIELGYDGKRFVEVEKMLPWATSIEKCVAACAVCGADARFTHKKADDDDDKSDIQVGGAETYEPRCFSCHPLIKTS